MITSLLKGHYTFTLFSKVRPYSYWQPINFNLQVEEVKHTTWRKSPLRASGTAHKDVLRIFCRIWTTGSCQLIPPPFLKIRPDLKIGIKQHRYHMLPALLLGMR